MIRLFFLLSCQFFLVKLQGYGETCPDVLHSSSRLLCASRERHTCWSVGVRDLDCPGAALCCFDGCGNHCLLKPVARISDPCLPSPCGPGTECKKSSRGNPVCHCKPGLVPKPDTITGCGPECVIDRDCNGGLVCINQKCQNRPDPCSPSPCGPGTTCQQNREGNPVCQCKQGLVPKPDTITGCGPECVIDSDCSRGLVCLNQKCTERPDPCDPSPCGPGTICKTNSQGNPVCQCKPGLIPKPDTITGCGPECTIDRDCRSGLVCRSSKCVEKPDPCSPSPCGPGTKCEKSFSGNPLCKCLPGLIPKPDTITGCGPECTHDHECESGLICQSSKCVPKPDPCDPSPCGPKTMCSVNSRGYPICQCLPGFIPKPDTITGCDYECQVDRDCTSGYICQEFRCIVKPDPCDPSPCGPGTSCQPNANGNPVCTCLSGLIPKPDTITGCGPQCEIDRDCNRGFICQNGKCIEKPDPCDPSPCGPGAICMVNNNGNPVCRCEEGLIPKPDTITGCGPECTVDSDCRRGYVCQSQECVIRPDPCDPSPCGSGALCSENSPGTATCRCEEGLIPKPDPFIACGPECVIDRDCGNGFICNRSHCVVEPDPCRPNPCGLGAICSGSSRSIGYECRCPEGYFGDAAVECKKLIIIGLVNPPSSSPPKESRNPFVIGQSHTSSPSFQQRPSGNRRPIVIGGALNEGGSSIIDEEPEILAIGRRRRPFKGVIGARYRK